MTLFEQFEQHCKLDDFKFHLSFWSIITVLTRLGCLWKLEIKFMVLGSRCLIRFRFNIFGEDYFMGGVTLFMKRPIMFFYGVSGHYWSVLT